ncbi:MAG TPA: hypothetical protein GX707_04710 [Epulopiscium sp.]|nr:hypothetical protein [Candidatus Epulonipiscium sp.]
MKKLMTNEDVNQIQFYKMPKDFFQNPKYMPLKNDSKLAYMLILDLLPLSIQNNWVNENNEVFIKISRTKLMALLNIKSTHKAAIVMKELVENGLIIYKKVGLNRCNEIYLYLLEDSGSKGKSKPKQTKAAPKKTPVVCDEVLDKRVDLVADQNTDQFQKTLEEQVHIEDLKQRYGDGLVDEILNNICEMYRNSSTRIGKQDKPMSIIRNVISKLRMYHIEYVIDQFENAATTSEIFSPKRYIQTLIYNSVYEANIKMTSHIRYNFGW